VVGFQQRNKGKGSGIWVDPDPWWGLYEIKDGRVSRFQAFWVRGEALRAAGLA
jgi:hypothetical protein